MVASQCRLKQKVTVWIVEHNPLAADYLQQILAREPCLWLLPVQDFRLRSPRQARHAAVFVIDRGTLPLPLSECLRCRRVRYVNPQTILLDEERSSEEICRLLFLGIQGLVAYGKVDEQLAPAIRAVSQGHLWVPPVALEQYVHYSRQLSRPKGKERGTLTRREKHIVELLQRRLSNKEITSILRISESTVKFHLSNIFAKLGVHDRLAAAEVLAARPASQLLLGAT